MTSEDDLKPCPFCGGEARIVVCDDEGNIRDKAYELDPVSGLWYSVTHYGEDFLCPISEKPGPLPWLFSTPYEAARSWNLRAERTCRMKRFMPDCGPGEFVPQAFLCKCSECGYEMFGRPVGANYCPGCGALVEVWE